jgi:Alpha/beta hydrolase family
MTVANLTPVRAELDLNGRRLSYLDFGGTGQPLLALHGHLDQGLVWSGLATALAPDWRVIAPDQRGHGESDRAADYSRDGYLADVPALLGQLNPGPVVALGHSPTGATTGPTGWQPTALPSCSPAKTAPSPAARRRPWPSSGRTPASWNCTATTSCARRIRTASPARSGTSSARSITIERKTR